eukprot:1002195-Prymnesium_polylepis.3
MPAQTLSLCRHCHGAAAGASSSLASRTAIPHARGHTAASLSRSVATCAPVRWAPPLAHAAMLPPRPLSYARIITVCIYA